MTAMNFKMMNSLRFNTLYNWSVHYTNSIEKNYSQKFPLKRIGDFLFRDKTPIEIQDDIVYKRVKIRINGGGISVRDEEIGKQIGTKSQFLVKQSQFLLSKIDARNGAFGVVPEECEGAIITGNFWTFDIDYEQINPHYLKLFTSTKHFQELCQRASNGTTNRNYLQEGLFINMEVPLPDLDLQNQLINQYNKNFEKAQKSENQANELEKGIESYLLNELGIELLKPIEKKLGLQFLRAKELSRWDCDFLENQWIFKLIIEKGKYQSINFGDILISSQYGISEMSDKEVKGLPMLRMNNIFNGELDISNLKYVEMKGDTSRLLLQKGDLLFNRTNSKELVGKTAIFDVDGDFLFASYLIRLKLDVSKIDLHYTNYLFNSKIIRTQINMVSRQIIGQANINLTELKSFVFPLPPPEIQTQIVNHITTQKEQIKNLRHQAEKLRKQAKENFEKEIFV